MERGTECEHSEEMTVLMSLALDHLLEEGERQRLDQHLATCPLCQSDWTAMQEVAALFEASPLVGPSLGFAVRVERRLEERSKRQRQVFGGLALFTSSLSLAGMTVAVALMMVMGIVAWRWLDSSPALQQGTQAVTQVASGMGLVGKGASLFLGDLLLRYGAPLLVLLGLGLVVLLGAWAWLFLKRPGNKRHNGFA